MSHRVRGDGRAVRAGATGPAWPGWRPWLVALLALCGAWVSITGSARAQAGPARGQLVEHRSLPMSFQPIAGTHVRIEVMSGRVVARLPGGRTQTLVEAIDAAERRDIPWVLRGDFNFDEAEDLAVLDATGYGGVNAFHTLFIWNPASGQFDALAEPLVNPRLVPERKAVQTSQRDGPRWSGNEYRSLAGRLYVAVNIDDNVLDGVDLLTFRDPAGKVQRRLLAEVEQREVAPERRSPAVVPIRTARAWLHDRPDPAARTGMYVIKDDRVTLLDHATRPGEPLGTGWFKVRFKGKRTIEAWVEGDALVP